MLQTAEGRAVPPRMPPKSSLPNLGGHPVSGRGGELPAVFGLGVKGKVARERQGRTAWGPLGLGRFLH